MEPVISVFSFVVVFVLIASTGGAPWGTLIAFTIIGSIFGLAIFEASDWWLKVIPGALCGTLIWIPMRLLACGIMSSPFFPMQNCM